MTDKCSGNYKLPLIFLAMLWPLMLSGTGRLSLDAWLCRRCHERLQRAGRNALPASRWS